MELDCIIEIPVGSNQKFEIDYSHNRMRLDRVLPTAMFYPGNYGYIPGTLCEDGDALDILMPVDYTIQPGTVVKCRFVGVMLMEDEEGKDEKIIVMPAAKVDARLAHIKNIGDIDVTTKAKIEHFFNHYKDLNPGKFVKTYGYKGVDEANKLYNESIERYNKSANNGRTHNTHKSVSQLLKEKKTKKSKNVKKTKKH